MELQEDPSSPDDPEAPPDGQRSFAGICRQHAVTAGLSEPIGELTPSLAMTVLAIAGMVESPLAALDEESVTASFVARMAAHYAWAVAFLGKDGPPALWGQYSKNGQGEGAESRRGADFALVVPQSAERVRVAIFQAKKVRGGVVQLGQEGSATHSAPQLAKLIETAATIEQDLGLDVGGGAWVHYVFWNEQDKVPGSVSLAELEINDSGMEIDVQTGGFVSLADLLSGAMRAQAPHWQSGAVIVDGWLELAMEEAVSFLPKLLAVTDAIFVDDEGSAGGLAHALSMAAPVHLQAQRERADVLLQPTATRSLGI